MDMFYTLSFLKYKHDTEVTVMWDLGLLECGAVSIGEWFLTFWRTVVSSLDSITYLLISAIPEMSQTARPM
jgi:D-serine deaminase-like pyridoxal phosphate-dependent protein